jgi:hypothetical protein
LENRSNGALAVCVKEMDAVMPVRPIFGRTGRKAVVRIGNRIKAVVLPLLFVLFGVMAARAQTDVAASLYGAFSASSRGNNVIDRAADSAGVLLEARHISSPLSGYEVAYSYHRANQAYSPDCSTSTTCGTASPASVSANTHQLDLDWLASVRVASIRPFALAGFGLQFNRPSGNQSETSGSTKPVFLYGLGLDWALAPHAGLRFQYRKNLYKAPGITHLYSSTGSFTHTMDLGIGYYVRF